MKLTLDHTQRLNLHTLLGAQRADVGSIRAIWAVQDKLALNADEEKIIELRRGFVDGQERIVWNPLLLLPSKDLDFLDTEITRMNEASDRKVGQLRRNHGSAVVGAPVGPVGFVVALWFLSYACALCPSSGTGSARRSRQ